MTKSAAAPNGIRVDPVAPGPTDTGLPDRFTETAENESNPICSVPLGRIETPDEIADVVASDRPPS